MNGNINFTEYLGSDGRKISFSYNLYLEKCDAFISKARNLKSENCRRKKSLIQSDMPGYESCEELEEKYLVERDQYLKEYNEAYDWTRFDDGNMFENFTEKTKQIRIIRELSEPVCSDSKLANPAGDSWLWRFCMLSKFIQAARMIILKRRMEKRLDMLKTLTPLIIDKLEGYPPQMNLEPEAGQTLKTCKLTNPFCPALCKT